jgi:hypothetical protein
MSGHQPDLAYDSCPKYLMGIYTTTGGRYPRPTMFSPSSFWVSMWCAK